MNDGRADVVLSTDETLIEWAVLKTRGICIGVVEHLSEVAQADESFSCLEKRCYAAVEGFCQDFRTEMQPQVAIVSKLVSDYSRCCDLICVLFGCSVPMVLRKRES